MEVGRVMGYKIASLEYSLILPAIGFYWDIVKECLPESHNFKWDVIKTARNLIHIQETIPLFLNRLINTMKLTV